VARSLVCYQRSVPTSVTGTLTSLRRYPIKSMAAEELGAAPVGRAGLAGDRGRALVDAETGRVASAKHPRKWGELLLWRAAYEAEPMVGAPLPDVLVTWPDGSSSSTAGAGFEARAGERLGRPVRLVDAAPDGVVVERWWPELEGFEPPADARDRTSEGGLGRGAPAGSLFDFGPIHLVTTATLEALAALEPEAGIVADRFRPNLVLDVDVAPFAENGWAGWSLQVGDVDLELTVPTPRCVVTTLAQPGLARSNGVLRAATRANRVDVPGLGTATYVGAYATVVGEGAGTVARGSAVVLRPPAASA
jgi:uncharacterized protein YcbX